MPVHFKQITIVGIGLMGGSLAGAIRARKLADKIVGIDRDLRSLLKAVELGLIDAFCSAWSEIDKDTVVNTHSSDINVNSIGLRESIEGAELIILATPVGSLVENTCRLFPYVNQGTVITDVGSVKAFYLNQVEPLLPAGVHLVGGHPIAGTERSGVEASNPTLFSQARCILTPTPHTASEALECVRRLWHQVGAEVIEMDPEAHDRALAAISHLPHMAAYSLVNSVDELALEDSRMLSFPGGGFRDFTRVASSHPLMWRDICLFNRDHILQAIKCFQETLQELKACVEDSRGEDLEAKFTQARRFRGRMQGQLFAEEKKKSESADSKEGLIIAIDGPAAAGKSTLGNLVAQYLGYIYINTGAIYRAVAWKALEEGVALEDHGALERISAQLDIQFGLEEEFSWKVKVHGQDLSQELRREEIGKSASIVSAIPQLREALLGLQRRPGKKGGVVMDGRDIGTVVFPEADVKFYLEADPEERSRRRCRELNDLGMETDFSDITADIAKRDADDRGRLLAPLKKAEDAITIDTTCLSVEEVKKTMLKAIRRIRQ